MDTKTIYSISELAAEFEVTTRTIRFYEAKGLIMPARDGQTRIYSVADKERLSLILRGKRLGFNLTEVADMLDLYKTDDKKNVQSENIVSNINEHIDILKRKRDDIDEAVKEMLSLIKEYE
jgi:DNA-binding transcriptional MerR regulator